MLKSVIVGNLFGVDILPEAVEICKLRLFLKLVSQIEVIEDIEPLPDIDFNVKTGNALVGFTSIEAVRAAITTLPDEQARMLLPEEQAALEAIEDATRRAGKAYQRFVGSQTSFAGSGDKVAKEEVRAILHDVKENLDRYLAEDYGVASDETGAPDAWLADHRPFHWFVEYYGQMSTGGFDVVIGNPPYVSSSKVNYLSGLAERERFPDIYANVVLRALELTRETGRCSMIVPLSVTFSRQYKELRRHLLGSGSSWFSSYDNIPAALFTGVSQRCTIWLGHKDASEDTYCATGQLNRWRASYRAVLLENLEYVPLEDPVRLSDVGLPKDGPSWLADT